MGKRHACGENCILFLRPILQILLFQSKAAYHHAVVVADYNDDGHGIVANIFVADSPLQT